MSKSGKSTTLATTFFLFSKFLSKSSCKYDGQSYMHKGKYDGQSYMHKTENKRLWKGEMSYGEIWYMGRIYEELKLRLRLANFHLHN